MCRLALFFLGLGLRALGEYSPEALKDEVAELPGLPGKLPWRMFSGYVDVSAPRELVGSRQMFYWFIESQKAPTSDPVLLWTNGGPGCSGLGGLLSELGPFRAQESGKSLALNPFAWNKLTNLVFIEQPVGVGFSNTSIKLNYGDAQAAADNHRFVLGFFERFKQYKFHDFYIASESYGGHYMPTLAQKLKEAGDVPQFRGVFLGNPLTYMMYRNFGQYGTAWGHQLLPAPLWKKYEDAGCATSFPPSDACSSITDEMDKILEGFDPYALDFPTCNTPNAAGRHERWVLQQVLRRAKATLRGMATSQDPYEPCIGDFMTAYLNRADVQTAIHVKIDAKWSMCSNVVGAGYNLTDVNSPMMDVWRGLIEKGDLKIMIYSGDDDAICATLGSQQFIWDLGYAPKTGGYWTPWTCDGQVAGFKTDFEVPSRENKGSFSFVTVHGAGHMVPATQPARSLNLLAKFLGAASTKIIV